MKSYLLALSLITTAQYANAQTISYKKQIAPIFAASCKACHSGPNPQSGLDISTYAALSKGGRRGKSITPGDPSKSLLVQYIDGTKQPRMPIGGALKASEIALVVKWVKEGAKVDGDANATTTVSAPKIILKVKVLPPAASLAWNKDGHTLAMGTYQEVKLIDSTTGHVIKTLPGHADVVRGLAFSPDGNTLAAGGGVPGVGGEIKLWNVANWTIEKTLKGHTDCIYGLAWRPDGKQIATTSYDKTVKLWDITKDAPTADLKEHSEAVYSVGYNKEGKLFATAGADRAIRVWDANTGKRLYTLAGHTDMVTFLAFHPTANQLASASADKTVRVWSLKADSGNNDKTLGPLPDMVTSVCFSLDGKHIAATCNNGSVTVWDKDSGNVATTIKAGDDTALSVAYRPDSQMIAVGGYDGSVKLFAPDGKLASTPVAAPARSAQNK